MKTLLQRLFKPADTTSTRPQVATRARMGVQQLLGNLPNPDPILKAAGKDVASYRALLSQPRIGGNVRRRKAAVLGLQRALVPEDASDPVFNFIDDWLDDIDLDALLRGLLDAPLYGYQPVELVWQPLGRYWVPEVIPKPPEWFRFDADGQLRLMAKDAGQEGELCNPAEFVIARHEATWINPYGQPDLAMCYWPGNFLKSGLKFWVQFVEKYGSPWVIGKHPRGNNPEETERLLESLDKMQQDATAAFPDDASIEIVEAGGKGASSEVFQRFLEYCRSDINVALLGQDQTTDKDTNHASATAGAEVAASIRDGDKGVVLSALNRVIALVVAANFGEVAAPRYGLWEQETIDTTRAGRDQMLYGAGFRFTPAYGMRTYDLEEGDLDTAAMAAMGAPSPYLSSPAFAESSAPLALPAPADMADLAALDAATQTLKVQSAPLVEGWLDEIKALVEATPGDLDALQDRLLAAYGNLDEADLVEVMGSALELAAQAGRRAVTAAVNRHG